MTLLKGKTIFKNIQASNLGPRNVQGHGININLFLEEKQRGKERKRDNPAIPNDSFHLIEGEANILSLPYKKIKAR